MTEPPQQPGPPEPTPTPTGEQPTVSYGFPGGPAEPPVRKSKAGLITLIVVVAVLVIGGGGAGVYFLTKGDDDPKTNAAGTSQSGSPTGDPSAPQSGPASGSNAPSEPPPSNQAPNSGPAAPTTGQGGGGGGGGGADDAAIVQVADKYAKAVSGKDEAGAKAVTCDNDPGLLYSSAEKVEVVGKPEKYGDDTASINVKVNLGGGSEPIDNFPLFMDKKNNAWCISN